MPLTEADHNQLRDFLDRSSFLERGAVITDLDGTALHEERGRTYVPRPVELGLKKIHDIGRPVILNSLRFPLSVIRTFGMEWYGIANTPIPVVLLNGSILGHVIQTQKGELAFEEMRAFPLSSEEIEEVLYGVSGLLSGGIHNILVFYYPRDWRKGEIIWTPVPENIVRVRKKYPSAAEIVSSSVSDLKNIMKGGDICMIFLLIDAHKDTLMAYQHTKRNSFFTSKGVDKLFGARQMANALHVSLSDSIGAGDTELDTFLKGVGLAVHVGSANLAYKGSFGNLKISNSFELGDLFLQCAEMGGMYTKKS